MNNIAHVVRGLLVAGGLLLSASPALTHHGNSAFDRTQTIRVSGVVTNWQFINPHAGIWIDVTDEDGNIEEWSGEFQSVQDLYRFFSWNKDTFKPGDTITLIGNPDRRADQRSMWVEAVIFSDGTETNIDNNP